jgi:hypothetical protein
MNEERLARGLGWFSIGIGLAEIIAPRSVGRGLGMGNRAPLLRLYGVREIATGIGILSQEKRAPWLWARVAGDLLDLATLATARGKSRKSRSIAVAAASVVGVTAMDVVCAKRLAEREEPAERREMTSRDEPARGERPESPEAARMRLRRETPPTLRPAPAPSYGKNLLDLNEATREELFSISGLSDAGAEAILRYRNRHGRIRQMYELERLPQLTVDEFIVLRDVVQITAETEEEEAHRLEKPDISTEPGGRGM